MLQVLLVPTVDFRRAEEEPRGGRQNVFRTVSVARIQLAQGSTALVSQFSQLFTADVVAGAVVLATLHVFNEPLMNGVGLAPVAHRDVDHYRPFSITPVEVQKAEDLAEVLVLVVLVTRDKTLGAEKHIQAHIIP